MKTYIKSREDYEKIFNRLNKVYFKVVKNFPDIKKQEIRLEYQASVPYAELNIINRVEYFVWNKLVKDTSITIGDMFFKVNKEQRKAIIAHELGHYKRHKKYGINKIGKHIKMLQEVDAYKGTETGETLDHRTARMVKCLIMHELYADQETVKAGYGKPLLSFLKMAGKKHKERLPRLQKEELKLRIKNLEEKLKQEKGIER